VRIGHAPQARLARDHPILPPITSLPYTVRVSRRSPSRKIIGDGLGVRAPAGADGCASAAEAGSRRIAMGLILEAAGLRCCRNPGDGSSRRHGTSRSRHRAGHHPLQMDKKSRSRGSTGRS